MTGSGLDGLTHPYDRRKTQLTDTSAMLDGIGCIGPRTSCRDLDRFQGALIVSARHGTRFGRTAVLALDWRTSAGGMAVRALRLAFVEGASILLRSHRSVAFWDVAGVVDCPPVWSTFYCEQSPFPANAAYSHLAGVLATFNVSSHYCFACRDYGWIL